MGECLTRGSAKKRTWGGAGRRSGRGGGRRRGGINRAYLRADWRSAQSSEISGKRMGGRRVPRSSSPAARGRD